MEGKGTTNAIDILRNIIERSLEHQKDLFLCFIDYTKAFDKVRHEKLLDILKQLDVDGKDIRIIGKMYWEQTAAVKIQNEISTYKPIKRGVRQGCVLSPDLFSIYSEMIMRNIEGLPGIKINGQLINNLRYADDTVLIAENEEDLKHLLDKIVEESGNMGLSLNSKKTEVMTISRNKNTPNCNITIDGTKLKQVEKFKYLGTIITSDGKSKTEIKTRITLAKKAFSKMNNVFKEKSLSLELRILQCYIEPVLTYGCESWTVDKDTERRLEAVEIWFLRRMLRIPWTEKRRNVDIMEEIGYRRRLLRKINIRKAKFFGHVMRRGGMESLVTTGRFEGKRARGKQRMKILDQTTAFMRMERNVNTIQATKGRSEWRVMVANAAKQGTE